MIEIKGQYNTAKVFTDNLPPEAAAQILELCNQDFIRGSVIRIMPDTHAGAGCVIGTTMTIADKVVPNLVGVDIGCGMETIKLNNKDIDLAKLDQVIHEYIPAGFDIRKKQHAYADNIDFDGLVCKAHLKMDRARLSVGTLGGGNHFVEVNRDSDGAYYLVIHSGSRYLGKQVAEYYQDLGYKELAVRQEKACKEGPVSDVISRLKAEGRQHEIYQELQKHKLPSISKQLAYVLGKSCENYLNDMKIVQRYAVYNRKAIADEIVRRMGLSVAEQFTTIHNYIDLNSMILRKGAISAQQGEKVLIPMNMRDGSLICTGKGNPDWNYSAPHGAGRLMSRKQAKAVISMADFRQSMTGIYSTTVNPSTLDECALAYKPMDEIVKHVQETIEILDVIKPVYNFKAAD